MCVIIPINIIWLRPRITGVDSCTMVLEWIRGCWCNQIIVRMRCPSLQYIKSISMLCPCVPKVQLTYLLVDSDGTACGRFERLYSDHCDYVSTSAFDGAYYASLWRAINTTHLALSQLFFQSKNLLRTTSISPSSTTTIFTSAIHSNTKPV